ncbi:MAG: hypothetical protein ACP5M9_01615 [Candidatus Micrarchaeia archaeon]
MAGIFKVKSVKNTVKLQSTVEYLITHGWALLIIAIALFGLYLLGVFSPGPINQCLLNNGVVCQSYVMNTNGILMLTLLNSGNQPINVTGIACYESTNTINYQKPGTSLGQFYLSPDGSGSFYTQCYANNKMYNSSFGGYFSGELSVTYVNPKNGIAGELEGTVSIKPTETGGVNPAQVGVEFSDQLTITNSQNMPVPSGFQQEISINPSAFAQYGLNQNMSNLIFTTGAYGSGSPIDAWIESGASNTATTSTIWVKLPSGINANNGKENIYMNIVSSNEPVSLGYTGYAPQLYCASGCFQTTYAEYDNGAQLFNLYSDFKGTQLSNIFSNPQACSSGLTIDNGYTMNTIGCGNNQYEGLLSINSNIDTSNGILLSYVPMVSGPGGVIWCWLTTGYYCSPDPGVSKGQLQMMSLAPNNDMFLYTIDSLNANSINTYVYFTVSYLALADYPVNGQIPSVSCSIGSCN